MRSSPALTACAAPTCRALRGSTCSNALGAGPLVAQVLKNALDEILGPFLQQIPGLYVPQVRRRFGRPVLRRLLPLEELAADGGVGTVERAAQDGADVRLVRVLLAEDVGCHVEPPVRQIGVAVNPGERAAPLKARVLGGQNAGFDRKSPRELGR